VTKPNPDARSCSLPGAAPINERFSRGLKTMQTIDPEQTVRILSGVSDIAPDFAAYLVEYAFGDIGSRPGLDLKQREFAAVAALAAMGNAAPQLKARLHGALKLGWSREELVELLMQISVHAGFPAAINALTVLRDVVQEQEASDKARFAAGRP
jgi:4-carboxymuconolactone decarboxylase